jgi:creatinine amidohydrolase
MSDAKWGQYERLRPAQIEAIRDAAPIAYVPWGALEWHSYHNPIGLDGLKAHGLMCELAKKTGGVVLPPVYLGTDTIKPFKGFPHTIDFPRAMVKAVAHQFLEQLVDEKFGVLVLLTGHYGGDHLKALAEVAEEFGAEHPSVGLWVTSDYYVLEGRYDGNHAAWGETSLQLLFDAELVDISKLPQDRVATLDEDGVAGRDPRQATREGGAEQLAAFLEVAVPHVKRLLEKVTRS